jgi:adenylate cyclase
MGAVARGGKLAMEQQQSVRVGRRLAAIVAADVAGYSRLMGLDEVGTARTLREHRVVTDALVAKHGGRLVKSTGDGVLLEFPSVVDAVECAVAVQAVMDQRNEGVPVDRRMLLRIGINLGDILIEGDDILGDGVNVAARLEGIAEPGGICISSSAYDQVRGKVEVEFADQGEQRLKNIDRPVRVYTAKSRGHVGMVGPDASSHHDVQKPLPLPDKPSIAVLPFQNMSGDPEQEYFADGMVEEITTALSRFKWLFVIARNSSFTFKGKAVDVKEVGRRLGVRYVLEGSVRKASGKVRITGQLIDATTGAHIWADRFERDLTDVFALQDEVAVAVVSAIQPRLLQTEIARATRRRPENLTAYDFFLRALPKFNLTTREGVAEAIRLAHRALELDPRFGFAAALAGAGHMLNVIWGHAVDPQFDRKEAIRLLRLALSIDDSDPEILAWVSVTSAYMVGDCEGEIEMADRAVALNPNSYNAWRFRGWVYKIAGLSEEAVRSFERAIRVSPIDPQLHILFVGMGMAFIELRRFDEAIVAGKKAQRQDPSYAAAYRCLVSAFAHLGRDAEAREAAAHLLETDPGFAMSAYIARGGQSNAKLLIEGLRKAGLPE